MSSLNRVELLGHIGKDVELKHTQGGVAYCRASLATKSVWTDQSGKRNEETEWHNVVVWKKQAENLAKYCRKGSRIYVGGRLKTRTWESNGQKHYSTEIQAHELIYLDGSSGGGSQREESPPKESRPRTGKPLDVSDQMGDQELPEDIPF
jgi:single-strand DNA-binding protein